MCLCYFYVSGVSGLHDTPAGIGAAAVHLQALFVHGSGLTFRIGVTKGLQILQAVWLSWTPHPLQYCASLEEVSRISVDTCSPWYWWFISGTSLILNFIVWRMSLRRGFLSQQGWSYLRSEYLDTVNARVKQEKMVVFTAPGLSLYWYSCLWVIRKHAITLEVVACGSQFLGQGKVKMDHALWFRSYLLLATCRSQSWAGGTCFYPLLSCLPDKKC